jgi:hypothetical protein
MPTWRGTTDSNWGTATNWLTDGSGSGVPTANTDATFDAASPACTITSGANCRSLNCAGYANTITFANTLNVNMSASGGDITFSNAPTFSMVGPNGITYIVPSGAAIVRTLNVNSYVFNLPFATGGSSIVGSGLTLVGSFQVSNFTGPNGNFNFFGTTGNELRVSGNFAGSAQGSALKVFNGAGTMAAGSSIAGGLTINAPTFTRTFAAGAAITIIGSFVRTDGTISATGSTLQLNCNTISLDGQTVNNVTMLNSGAFAAITVPTSMYLTGNLITNNGTQTWSGAGRIYVAGNLTAVATLSGSVVVEMNGTGTISGTHGFPIEVNTATTTTIGTTCSLSTFTLTTGTLNLANQLGINGGTLTIAIGFNFTGSSNLTLTGNIINITSNGVAWPTSIIMAPLSSVNSTITLNDSLTVTGSFSSTSLIGATVTLNGGPLNVNGNLTVTKTFGGTTDITILGTGTSTWSGAGEVGCNLNINKTGNFTVSGPVGFGNSKTLLYTNIGGLFTVAGSTLTVSSCTLSLGITVWNNLTIRASGSAGITHTVTLTGNTTFTGNFIANGAATNGLCAVNGLFNLNIGGSMTLGSQNGTLSGTSTIVLNGTGTWSGGAIGAGPALYSINIDVNSPSGAITVGTIAVGGGRIRCIAAATFTANGTINFQGGGILDASSFSNFLWNDFALNGNTVITLDSNVSIRDLILPNTAGTNQQINGNGRIFTVSAANASVGAVYSNNGQTFTVLTTISGGTTLTCSQLGAPTASGTLTKVSGTGDTTITFSSSVADGIGRTINIRRNITHNNSLTFAGTAKLIMIGSGTWAHSSSGGVGLDLELNSPAGTIIIGSSVIFGNSKTLKYTNVSTLTTTGSTLSIVASATLDLLNTTWGNFSNPSNSAITLLSNADFNNVTLGTVSSGTSQVINGLFNLNVRGNFTNNQTSGGISGTGTIRFTGTGNWGGAAAGIVNNVIIDTAGAVTLTINITWGSAGRTFTVTAGTLNMGATTLTVSAGTTVTINPAVTLNAGTSTVSVGGGALTIFNTNSKNLFNVTVSANGNISIGSLLSVTGTLRLLGAATFTGISGWTCATLVSAATGAFFITLQEGITYTTTAAVSITGGVAAVGSRPTMTSSSGVNRAIWTLNQGAAQSMIYVNGTRIDSSGGQPIYSFGVAPADISTTINWYIGTRPGTVAYVFVY